MSLWKLSSEDLLSRIAVPEPTPGGGSVAIIAGCLGLALLRKALAVSRKRDPEANRSSAIEEALSEFESVEPVLRESADCDAAGFDHYICARRLPRGTPFEVEAREKAIELALIEATEIPIQAAAAMRRMTSVALRCLPSIHVGILSDAIGGLHLLMTSAVTLLAAADSNLAQLSVSAQSSKLTREAGRVRTAIRQAEADLVAQLGSWASTSISEMRIQGEDVSGREDHQTPQESVL
jgi:glutamate formiminotransferase/formiminotetrahydrofolate cyclodeaminase